MRETRRERDRAYFDSVSYCSLFPFLNQQELCSVKRAMGLGLGIGDWELKHLCMFEVNTRVCNNEGYGNADMRWENKKNSSIYINYRYIRI